MRRLVCIAVAAVVVLGAGAHVAAAVKPKLPRSCSNTLIDVFGFTDEWERLAGDIGRVAGGSGAAQIDRLLTAINDVNVALNDFLDRDDRCTSQVASS